LSELIIYFPRYKFLLLKACLGGWRFWSHIHVSSI